ncbi:rod shape-determining protein MreC, partial [Stenotrophomonas maltophilia]
TVPAGAAPATTTPAPVSSPVVPAAGRQQPSSQARTVAPASSLDPAAPVVPAAGRQPTTPEAQR